MNNNLILENLPTGKPHISFSELKEWQECSWRHKLHQIEKIDLFESSPILDFGTAVHASCENFLRTRALSHALYEETLISAFEKNKEKKDYTQKNLESFLKEANKILQEIPGFMEETFPGWEFVDAEHQLYEPFSQKHPHAFKGFIDGIIKTKGKKEEDIFWIIDWKTSAWGWNAEKRSDFGLHQQLILYKNFWSQKTGIPLKQIKCGFIVLKRTAKDGQRCELIKISVGPVTSERSIKNLSNMVSSIKRGISLKNKDSCTFCPYKGTEHCV